MKLIRTLVLPIALTSCARMGESAFPNQTSAATDSAVPVAAAPAQPEAAAENPKVAALSESDSYALAQLVVSYHDQASSVIAPSNRYMKRLVRLTKRHRDEDGLQLSFKVYQSADVTVQSFADGSLRLTSGLMDLMRDEELLAVIGHEIGHIKLGHSGRQLRAAFAASNPSTGAVPSISAANVGALTSALLAAKNSMSQEFEADSYGLQFLARHNYNPRGAVKALNKLAHLSADSSASCSWLFVHPAARERATRLAGEIEQLKRDMPASAMAQNIDPMDDDEIAAYEPPESAAVRTATLSRTPAPDAEPAVAAQPEPPTAAEPAPVSQATPENVQTDDLIDPANEIKSAPPKPAARSAARAPDSADEEPLAPGWYVQVSAEAQNEAAVDILQKLHGIGFTGQLQRALVKGTRYTRVLVGPFLSQSEAFEARAQIKPHNLGTGSPFVKEIR